jgi:hypothetical protein
VLFSESLTVQSAKGVSQSINMTQTRKRAARSADNTVGQERYALYKATFEWISKSINEGFYLEAISLEESLITDRLESYLTWLRKTDFSFKTLGDLKKAIEQHETDSNLRLLVLDELDSVEKSKE